MQTENSSSSPVSRNSVVVVGAGGNIGSHLVSHLARMPEIGRVSLIDRDVYERSNLRSQDITPGDVGKFKANVQARRLRRINRELRVEAIADVVERVPLGRLRADVILACLDSRIARQRVSQYAWRLGVPLIDAGVEPGGLLARINVYVPGPDSPCMECAWDDRDYEALEQSYPCAGFSHSVAATNAPSSLGALAASLQAIECQKFLSEEREGIAVSKQVLIDAAYHKHYVTAFRRNPRCRFGGHDVWSIENLYRTPGQISLGEALGLAGSGNLSAALRVEGKPFVKRLTCSGCGTTHPLLRLECSVNEAKRRCDSCGRRLIASGFDSVEELAESGLSDARLLRRSLRSLGLRPGDVFTIRDGDEDHHYELAGDWRSSTCSWG